MQNKNYQNLQEETPSVEMNNYNDPIPVGQPVQQMPSPYIPQQPQPQAYQHPPPMHHPVQHPPVHMHPHPQMAPPPVIIQQPAPPMAK